MSIRFGSLTLALAIAFLLGPAANRCSAAPTASISVKSGYVAGPPTTAQPSGSFTVTKTVAGDEYQVIVDYGTFGNNNTFTPWVGPAAVTVGIVPSIGTSIYTWGPTAVTNIPQNPPAMLQVRAQLQWRNAVNKPWVTIAVGYTPCP
jgi:hypothetical protein